MTPIKKPVRRKTREAYNVLFSGATKARPIVCSILPGDVLEFKEHGRRGRWTLAIHTAFRYAVRLAAFAEAAEKHRRNPKPKRRRK